MAASVELRAKFVFALILAATSLISAVSPPPTIKVFVKVLDSDKLQLLEPNSDVNNNVDVDGARGTASEVVLECSAPYPIQWTYKGVKRSSGSSEQRLSPALKNVTVTYYAPAPHLREEGEGQGQGHDEYKATITITGLPLPLRIYEGIIAGQYKCEPRSVRSKPTPTRFIRDTQSQSGASRPRGEGQVDSASLTIAIVGKEEITLPALDELVIRPKNEVQLGEKLEVRCQAPTTRMVDSDGSFRWWTESRADGLEPKSTLTRTDLDCSSADCKFLISDLSLASIHCSVRSLRSQDAQAALEIHVKGPSEPPHIKLAFVRDNQDFEQIGNGDGDFEDVDVQGAGDGLPQGQGRRQARASAYYNKTFEGYRFKAPDFGKNGQTLYVQCRAPYPVEWTYSGYFAPQIMSTTQRYVPSIDLDHLSNQNTYYFITEVIIRDFKTGYTGEYACRKISDYKTQAGVYLYFADPTAVFLPAPSETTYVQYANVNANTPNANPAASRRRFFVQCAVSDPLQAVTIWKKDEGEGAETWTKWRPSRSSLLRFNPKFGFEVQPEPNLPIVGTYACRNARGDLNSQSQPTIVASKLEGPQPTQSDSLSSSPSPSSPSTPFSVTPTQSRVSLNPPRVQVLVCESHEEVTLQFSDPALRSTLVISRNATGNTSYKYSALAIIETFKRRPDSLAGIACVAVARPARILHRWLLTNRPPGQITKFTYAKAKGNGTGSGSGSYVCCGSGYLRPQITIVGGDSGGCHSVTECRLQACLKNSKCERAARAESRVKPIEVDFDPEGPVCTERKVDDYMPDEGMLLCDLGVGDVPYLSFSYLLYHRNRGQDPETSSAPPTAPSEINSRFWNLNTDVIRGEGGSGLTTETPGLLKIRRARSVRQGTEKFVCEGSRFFFSLGFYWILERDGDRVVGGSGRREPKLEYLTGADKMSTASGGEIGSSSPYTSLSTYKSTLYLQPEQLAGANRIRCVAPEWNSFRWRESSIPI